MRFEWDEDKRQATLARRGIDFIGMAALFDGRPVVTFPSPRLGEERWVTVGWVEGKAFAVVWTLRGGNVRIISARRARDGEERAYRELHG
jgi:uncharacterized DUF497 family protein